ncbi:MULTISPECIES: JAB-like toxin 1 domain-containing protein [Flavobacterium]|nr:MULTISPECIES: JAB-like toxin 1 domain-containing protein [Flavobacterium]
MLPSLSNASELTQDDGSAKHNQEPVYYAKTNNSKDVMNVFKFLSDNSPVEFGLLGNKKNEWVIGTMRSNTVGAMLEKVKGFDFKNLTTHIHSHGENNQHAFRPSRNDVYIAKQIRSFNPSAAVNIYMPQLNMKNWNKAFPNQKINYNPDKMYKVITN